MNIQTCTCIVQHTFDQQPLTFTVTLFTHMFLVEVFVMVMVVSSSLVMFPLLNDI
jgi:hypothetical protein